MLYQINHKIFEPSGAGLGYPVVEHIFRGKTEKEAWGYFKAHLTTDSFFKACDEKGRFRNFVCSSMVSMGWVAS